ncbi:MAG: microcin C transport system substrate-binding protein, partial [Halieaceae bacterium]
DLDQFGLNLSEYWYEKLSDDDPDVAAGYIQKSQFYNQRPRPTYGLWINTARPGLDSIDVRVGIQHATNWDLVIEKFFRGDYIRMNTSHDGYGEWTNPAITARSFDIELATQAFSRAGFDKRGPDGILVNSEGKRLTFSLTTGYESLKDILTILKEEAIKAGLELRIEVLDGTTAWKKVQEKKHDIQFSAFSIFLEMYPRFWDFGHSDNAYDDAFLDDGSINPDRVLKVQTNNLESMAIPRMDELVDLYRGSSDKDEMMSLAYEMDQMRHDHASFVPGFVQPFYRVGHWRWVRYPNFFNHKHSEGASELYIHWIDSDLKKETQQARKDGETFPAQIHIYDQFK